MTPLLMCYVLHMQVALCYARAARHDWPSEWPSLFSDLLSLIHGYSPEGMPSSSSSSSSLSSGSQALLTARRVYLVLHHILKELSSKRLAADVACFAQVGVSVRSAWTWQPP